MTHGIIKNLLYPPVCMFCGKLLSGQTGLCTTCKKEAEWLKEPLCMCCGKPLVSNAQEYCPDCAQGDRWFDGGRGVFPYRGGMKKAVLDLKSRGRQENAVFLGKCMAACIGPLFSYWRPDCIVPVPLNRAKLCRRGYNQAKLLAVSVGDCLELPVRDDLLFRYPGGKEQKTLGRFARKKGQQGAFYTVDRPVPERILLVDDIYTTGSTLDAAAHALKCAGAEKIWFVTACMGSDF